MITDTKVEIRTMAAGDAQEVSALADVLIGLGYYPPDLVLTYLERSRSGEDYFSWVALDPSIGPSGKIIAFRFVFPPGRWEHGRGKGLSPKDWPSPLSHAAYFQSCFVDHAYMGLGIGGALAKVAIRKLQEQGAGCVIAHSWKESPHGSSFRYLSKMGFTAVNEHSKYWAEVDYICPRDGYPCHCTAIEMVLDLKAASEP